MGTEQVASTFYMVCLQYYCGERLRDYKIKKSQAEQYKQGTELEL